MDGLEYRMKTKTDNDGCTDEEEEESSEEETSEEESEEEAPKTTRAPVKAPVKAPASAPVVSAPARRKFDDEEDSDDVSQPYLSQSSEHPPDL